MSEKDSERTYGMTWDEIQKYDKIIEAIACKYSGNRELQEDVAQEVRLLLHTDTRLDISKFDPRKLDAAIRNTIRNKTIKVLKSRKTGRWQFDSLDALQDIGLQIDTNYNVVFPDTPGLGPPVDRKEGEEN